MPGLLLWWSQSALPRSNQRVQSASPAQLGSARAAQVVYPTAGVPLPLPGRLRISSFAPSQVATARVAQTLFPSGAVAAPVLAFPGTGQLLWTGLAPQLGRGLLAGTGQLLFTGLAPSIVRRLFPGTGALLLSGQATVLGYGFVTSTGQLVLTGLAPAFGHGAAAGTGLLTLEGFAVTLSGAISVAPPSPLGGDMGVVIRVGRPKRAEDEEILLLLADEE